MVTSPNPNSYSDVEQVLQAAREKGGLRYRLPTKGAAIFWRRRAYKYRTLLGKIAAAGTLTPDILGPTKWDDIILGLEGPEENVVVITFRQLSGQMEDLDGNPVEAPTKVEPAAAKSKPAPKSLLADDSLMFAAEELAKEMGDD